MRRWLAEQAVRDAVQSAFQSAGRRCSALRCLYRQEDIAEDFREMLFGAMEALRVGDPWHLSTDVGPVIDAEAGREIDAYIARAQADGRVPKRLAAPGSGHFVPPTVLAVTGVGDLEREIFGPHQTRAVESPGGTAVAVPEAVKPEYLARLQRFGSVVWWGDGGTARAYAQALAGRDGAILPLITGAVERADVLLERHVCVDTTASGGNAELLAEVGA